jgi:hypothetical protein
MMEIIVDDHMKNRWSFLACAVFLSLPAGIASAKVAAPQTIWAKADVGYDQYRADALECGMQGLAVNIDDSEEVKTLARASEQLEAIDASAQAALHQDAGQFGRPEQDMYVHNGLDIAARKAAEQQAVIATARTDEQYARIKEMMFKVVRSCMLQHGYTKIVLTEDQRNEYSEMKGGADARRAYLHELASDPHVLETQREAVAR